MNYINLTIQLVAEEFCLDPDRLRTDPSSQGLMPKARSCVYLIIKELTGMSYHELGNLFNKDHGTVIHGIKQITEEINSCELQKKRIKELCQTIKPHISPLVISGHLKSN